MPSIKPNQKFQEKSPTQIPGKADDKTAPATPTTILFLVCEVESIR